MVQAKKEWKGTELLLMVSNLNNLLSNSYNQSSITCRLTSLVT